MEHPDAGPSDSCPACGTGALVEVAAIEGLPVHVGVLWRTRAEATACATGDLRLAYCGSCGLLTNTAFDESLLDYSLEYDNSLHASAVFREFEAELVTDLVTRHGLRGSTIVEVGGGSGRFLGLLCDEGSNRGTVYDPSIPAGAVSDNANVELIPEYFGSDTELGAVDLLVCRQVLEHVPDLGGFLGPIREALRQRPGSVGYFDVPNSTMLLEDLSIWDLVYEHCHYFVEESAVALLESAGLEIQRTWCGFGDQFLALEVAAATGSGGSGTQPTPDEGASPRLTAAVEAFAEHMSKRRAQWYDRLSRMRAEKQRAVVWGAGARAVSFFSMLGIGDEVAYLVDANPAKQGTYLAGSGHVIRDPGQLEGDGVDLVVLLNGIYREEIQARLSILSPGTELVVA